jgi:hypothetical protein
VQHWVNDLGDGKGAENTIMNNPQRNSSPSGTTMQFNDYMPLNPRTFPGLRYSEGLPKFHWLEDAGKDVPVERVPPVTASIDTPSQMEQQSISG